MSMSGLGFLPFAKELAPAVTTVDAELGSLMGTWMERYPEAQAALKPYLPTDAIELRLHRRGLLGQPDERTQSLVAETNRLREEILSWLTSAAFKAKVDAELEAVEKEAAKILAEASLEMPADEVGGIVAQARTVIRRKWRPLWTLRVWTNDTSGGLRAVSEPRWLTEWAAMLTGREFFVMPTEIPTLSTAQYGEHGSPTMGWLRDKQRQLLDQLAPGHDDTPRSARRVGFP